MNKTSLVITALVVVAVAATTVIGFLATQSAAAKLDTGNTASQGATQTGTAIGGNGGNGGDGGPDGDGGDGGDGGSASVSQSICQQIDQSGAFGSSSSTIKPCS